MLLGKKQMYTIKEIQGLVNRILVSTVGEVSNEIKNWRIEVERQRSGSQTLPDDDSIVHAPSDLASRIRKILEGDTTVEQMSDLISKDYEQVIQQIQSKNFGFDNSRLKRINELIKESVEAGDDQVNSLLRGAICFVSESKSEESKKLMQGFIDRTQEKISSDNLRQK
jgi:hypothetical protein